MNRYLSQLIARDLPKKMAVITGPRQVGKTTLAREVGERFKAPLYLNFDAIGSPTLRAYSTLGHLGKPS
jgi:uncharacterized protein